MRRTLVATATLALLAGTAQANDGVELSLRSRVSAAASAVPAKQAEAPASTARDPLPELMLREELERRTPRGECNAGAIALCYDLADGRIVYRQARQYMPKFDGLRPEAVSLRHNSLVFKYSFR